MKIGIDARWIHKESTGIGEYTISLIRGLLNSPYEYYLFFSSEELKRNVSIRLDLERYPQIQSILVPYTPFSLLGQVMLARIFKQLDLDLFHSTNFMVPLFTGGCKTISTFHDLIPFLFPEYAPQSKKSRYYWIYKMLVRSIVKKSSYIIVDSHNSKKDMEANFKVQSSRIGIVPLGVSEKFLKKDEVSDIQNRFGRPYFLYVGRFDPYKNIMGLLKAYREIKDTIAYDLVIVGPKDDRYPDPEQYVLEHNLTGVVHITGFVSDQEIVGLYRSAFALVLPSFYEGFGLPVLEAFSCGVPVIASNLASLPEVVGDAGLLINPNNNHDLVNAMKKISEDMALRQNLIQKGYERLKIFSKDKMIQGVLNIYQKLLGLA